MKLHALLLTSILLAATYFSFAQETFVLDWAIPMQTRTVVNHDQDGNFYHTGEFHGVYDFDPGPEVLEFDVGGTGYNGFVRKLDPDGNLIWAKDLRRTAALHGGFTIGPAMIDVDSEGSVYVIGKFIDFIDFDPGPEEYILSNESYNPAIFLLKLNADGDFVWAKHFPPFSNDLAGETKFWDFTVDVFDNVYFGGIVIDTVDFDAGIGTAITAGTGEGDFPADAFICKYNSDGDFSWVKTIGGNGADFIYTLDTDSEGNLVVAGSFKDTVDMDPGPGSLDLIATNMPGSNGFLSKFTPDGNLIWAKQFESSVDIGVGLETIKQLEIGTTNDIYLTGYGSACTIDFDLTDDEYLVDLVGGVTYTARYDSDANLKWFRQFNSVTFLSIALDKDNSVYTGGNFYTTVDFDPGPETFSLTNAGGPGNGDVFINKLDSTGNYMWTGIMTGDEVTSYPKNLFVDDNYSIYTSGDCQDSVDVEPGADLTNYFNFSGIGHGRYLQKIEQCHITEVSVSIEGSMLVANPLGLNYQWIDCDQFDEEIIGATDSAYLPPYNGNYAVIIDNGICSDTSDCVYFGLTDIDWYNTVDILAHPNPNKGTFEIEMGERNIASYDLAISDARGSNVEFSTEINGSEMRFKLASVSNGVYYLRLLSETDLKIVKLIVSDQN